jgi:hypothetical protein
MFREKIPGNMIGIGTYDPRIKKITSVRGKSRVIDKATDPGLSDVTLPGVYQDEFCLKIVFEKRFVITVLKKVLICPHHTLFACCLPYHRPVRDSRRFGGFLLLREKAPDKEKPAPCPLNGIITEGSPDMKAF